MKSILLLVNFICIYSYAVVQSDYLSAVKLQADGKIITAGNSVVNNVTQFGLIRLNSDGTLDTTFNGEGVVNTIIGSTSEIASLALQADNKIVAVGSATISNISYIAIARYNADGSLDTSFDTDGIVTATLNDGIFGSGIVLQPDGKIVAVGTIVIDGTPQFIIARFNDNGSLDGAFNGAGFAITPVNSRSMAKSVLIQSDNKLVVMGTSQIGQTGVSLITLVRYNTDGSIDTTFGTAGIVTTSIGNQALAFDGTLQSDDKIVVGGTSDGDFVIARYNVDGSLDTSFDGDGFVLTSLNDGDEIHAVAMQADGKIVAGGVSSAFFAMGRFDTNGTLDNTFGSGGVVTDMLHESAGINDIVIQADGKIIVAGFDDNRAAIARFNSDGSSDVTFANNGVLNSPVPPVTLDGEIIFDSFSLTKDAAATPDTKFNDVYTTSGLLFPIRVWSMHPSSSTQEVITLLFNIPQDFDTILPLELQLHLVVDNKAASGNNAAFLVQADFKGNNAEFGSTGAEQSVTSSTITFTEPTGNNLKHEWLTIPLINSGIFPGDIAFVAFTRGVPTGTEYNNDIYLSSVSFRYKKFVGQ